jgi:hypothetical protein
MLSFFRKKRAAGPSPAPSPHFRPQLEALESRDLPSVYTPAQIRQAYGFNQVGLTGAGQTIAIVDAFAHPNIFADVDVFDQTFGITPGLPSSSFLSVATPQGTPAVNASWALEIALDVEWAHAIAPGARILLVEARDNSLGNLLSAVRYAASQPGVSVVSLSWGTYEFYGENYLDSYFTTPPGHPGVTFVASSGDYGSPPSYPAISPNVLAVGGTSLFLDSWGSYLGESGWSGSGGGFSLYENEPSYQLGWQYTGRRSNPDIAYNADPYTGYYVYCSIPYYGYAGWWQMGGTSAAAPQWAALLALANQGRVAAGKATLDGPTQTLPALYALPSSYFHDILSGSNGGYVAGWGYDEVTGRGSPVANLVIQGLINYGTGPSRNVNRSPNQRNSWPFFWRTTPHADLLSSATPAPPLALPPDFSSAASSISAITASAPSYFGPPAPAALAAGKPLSPTDRSPAWESPPEAAALFSSIPATSPGEPKAVQQDGLAAQRIGLLSTADTQPLRREENTLSLQAPLVCSPTFLESPREGDGYEVSGWGAWMDVPEMLASSWICATALPRALPLTPIEASDWRGALALCFGSAGMRADFRPQSVGPAAAPPLGTAAKQAVLAAALVSGWMGQQGTAAPRRTPSPCMRSGTPPEG